MPLVLLVRLFEGGHGHMKERGWGVHQNKGGILKFTDPIGPISHNHLIDRSFTWIDLKPTVNQLDQDFSRSILVRCMGSCDGGQWTMDRGHVCLK